MKRQRAFGVICEDKKQKHLGAIHKPRSHFLQNFNPLPPNIHGHGIFFMGVLHKPKFRKGGGSIFPGEFSDIVVFLLPNFFGKLRKGVVHPGESTFRKGGKAVYSWG